MGDKTLQQRVEELEVGYRIILEQIKRNEAPNDSKMSDGKIKRKKGRPRKIKNGYR